MAGRGGRVAYITQEEPKFIQEMRKRSGFQEADVATKFTKEEQSMSKDEIVKKRMEEALGKDGDDDDDAPQMVVLETKDGDDYDVNGNNHGNLIGELDYGSPSDEKASDTAAPSEESGKKMVYKKPVKRKGDDADDDAGNFFSTSKKTKIENNKNNNKNDNKNNNKNDNNKNDNKNDNKNNNKNNNNKNDNNKNDNSNDDKVEKNQSNMKNNKRGNDSKTQKGATRCLLSFDAEEF